MITHHTSISRVVASCAIVAVTLVLGAKAFAQAPSGTVRGRILDAQANAFLQGASVTIEAQRLTTYSNRDGEFLLTGVATGAQQLRVSYTGLDTKTVNVNVIAGQVAIADVDLAPAVQVMAAFTVAADRAGRALAIMQQRASDNVRNVVAADAFGSAAEGNVADLLQRLPGVTVSYTSADPDQVSIRGVSPELSTVTIDGAPVSNAVAGTARTFRFTITSNIQMLESVEVTKSLMPEMDAASVGGAINLRSKAPFQSRITRSYQFQLGGNTETRSDSAHRSNPSMSGSLTRVFGAEGRRIGVTLAANYTP